ncbi:MAG: uL22m family ribosomal protein [Patescibacteria group bacterium]
MTKSEYNASSLLAYSPRKSRLIINAIRGMRLDKALEALTVINKGKSNEVSKLLLNAANNMKLSEAMYSNYKIDKITAEEAQKLYRVVPRARGSAFKIRRRYSRLKVSLTSISK